LAVIFALLDPDPHFNVDPDPDPATQINADPDPKPCLRGHGLGDVGGDELPQHVGQGGQLLLALPELDAVDEGAQQGRLLLRALVVAA
jgi:hypothetical protein